MRPLLAILNAPPRVKRGNLGVCDSPAGVGGTGMGCEACGGGVELTVAYVNTAIGSMQEGRWAGQVAMLQDLRPDLVGMSEADHLADPAVVAEVETALAMQMTVGPPAPGRHRIAAAWRPDVLELAAVETTYVHLFHHGYVAPRFTLPGLPVPLAVIVCHLCPSSADRAAQEAQILAARAWRWDGLGMIIGDVNHCPVWVDRELEEPDWSQVPPHNRSSRCLPRAGVDEPWVGDQIVGRRLAMADLTDIAAQQAVVTGDMSLLRPTGKTGRLRVDQAHVTPALAAAVTGYQVLDTGASSDHDGIAVTIDIERIDVDRLLPYA